MFELFMNCFFLIIKFVLLNSNFLYNYSYKILPISNYKLLSNTNLITVFFLKKIFILRLIVVCDVIKNEGTVLTHLRFFFLAQNLLPQTISSSPIYTLMRFIFVSPHTS